MSKWVIPFFLVFPLIAGAQESVPSASQDKASFERTDYPFEGEVTCDRLNVRLLPSSGAGSTIATILPGGTKVTVLGMKDGFFQILPPKGCRVWVFAKNIERTGDTGTVLNDNTPVRADSRINGKKLGTLMSGNKVTIVKEHMGWLHIQAPSSIPYYVGTKYIRRTGEAANLPPELQKKQEPPKRDQDAEALAKIREAEALVREQNQLLSEARISELDYRGVIRAYREATNLASSDFIRAQAESQVNMYEHLQKTLTIWREAKNDIDTKMDKLRAEKARLEAERLKKKTPKFDYTGYVHTVGPIWNRPGAFKLMMNDEFVCFLKAAPGREAEIEKLLKWHYKHYVGVKGTIVRNPEGYPDRVLVIVEEVHPLEKKKK